jgi:hypothetical protein
MRILIGLALLGAVAGCNPEWPNPPPTPIASPSPVVSRTVAIVDGRIVFSADGQPCASQGGATPYVRVAYDPATGMVTAIRHQDADCWADTIDAHAFCAPLPVSSATTPCE